ncbi:MAG TPA: cysteine/serine endopeptidase inhibitor [Streptosporangiaceae bacterium]|nr:cysteine/serine endopeptidase inhibitor [Streptosporangiaceae bacterium]
MRKTPATRRSLSMVLLAAAAASVALISSATASTGIPIGRPMKGSMTFYNNAGFGACGTQINAATQMLVAVSHAWWTTPNPNNDPLCTGISVRVTWKGHTITVPVEDKCPSCTATHIDLSEPAFKKLAPLSVGIVRGITWKFVNSSGQAIGNS